MTTKSVTAKDNSTIKKIQTIVSTLKTEDDLSLEKHDTLPLPTIIIPRRSVDGNKEKLNGLTVVTLKSIENNHLKSSSSEGIDSSDQLQHSPLIRSTNRQKKTIIFNNYHIQANSEMWDVIREPTFELD